VKNIYKTAVLIRFFEERILGLFSEGLLSGTTHTCIGQEIIPIIVSNCLQPQDIVWSNHRGHGHYLARTGDVKGLLAEIMGLPSGICGGRGGSQHLCNSNFFSNGVLGSTAPIAAGMALAEKRADSNAIVVLYLGDGAFGEGIVYETLNMASLWKLPLLIIVEDNQYAQTTHWRNNRAGTISNRVKAFDIPHHVISPIYLKDTKRLVDAVIKKVRQNSFPHVLIFDTYRLSSHSKGDDFRSDDELRLYKSRDPLSILRSIIGDTEAQLIEENARRILRQVEHEIRRVNPTSTD